MHVLFIYLLFLSCKHKIGTNMSFHNVRSFGYHGKCSVPSIHRHIIQSKDLLP